MNKLDKSGIYGSTENKNLNNFFKKSNIKPRLYQTAIVKTAIHYNTLVVLPTGMGKTLIAVLLSSYRLAKYGGKILIMAPTKPLVNQHFDTFKKFELNAHSLTGKINPSIRKEMWDSADVIIATPQTIANDIKNNILNLNEVSLLIVDEAHRCLKNYDYVFVAKEYNNQAKHKRILGLTASPGSDTKVIQSICSNLYIKAVETRTRQSPDVRPYIKQLDVDIKRINLPPEIEKISEQLKQFYKRKVEELKNRSLLFGRITKTNLIKLQARLHKTIASGNKNFNTLRGVSVCAQAIKIAHAIELAETQTIKGLYSYLNDIYDQAAKAKSKAAISIAKSKEFQEAYLKVTGLYDKGIEHPKINVLINIIRQLKGKKIIVFSQYRDTISLINSLLIKERIKSEVFIGQMKKKGYGLSQKDQILTLNRFRNGLIDVLVSSSVGEEGLDIPEVNVVIFYEPIPSAIRRIQRMGRTARLKEGKVIILMTRKTRDETYHWAAIRKEKKMYKVLDDVNKKMSMSNNDQVELDEFV